MYKNIENIIYEKNLMELFLDEVKETKLPIALFGCGNTLSYVMKFLDLHNLKPDLLVDNDDEKIGKVVENLIIHSPNIFQNNSNYIVLIVPQDIKIINQIREQLFSQFNIKNVYAFNCSLYMVYRNIQSYDSYKNFMAKNIEDIVWLYDNLEDNFSKETLLAFLKGRITSDYSYYDSVCVKDNYFPKDIIKLGHEEVFVDCGAYDGDTISQFIKIAKQYRRVYAFESDLYNYQLLKQYLKKNNIEKIDVFNNAVWNNEGDIKTNNTADTISRVGLEGDKVIKAVRLDDVIDSDVTFLKMDIEGAEYEAIQGACKIIINNKPKLAICVYHKYEDLVNIPKFIKRLNPEYKLFLRQHASTGYELVLYAVI